MLQHWHYMAGRTYKFWRARARSHSKCKLWCGVQGTAGTAATAAPWLSADRGSGYSGNGMGNGPQLTGLDRVSVSHGGARFRLSAGYALCRALLFAMDQIF